MFKEVDPIAKEAYAIFRGMQQPVQLPHWEDLTNQQKGLYEWIARFTWLHFNGGET